MQIDEVQIDFPADGAAGFDSDLRVCGCETSADGYSVKPLACCVSVKSRSLSHYGDSRPAKSPLTCQENKYPVPHYIMSSQSLLLPG